VQEKVPWGTSMGGRWFCFGFAPPVQVAAEANLKMGNKQQRRAHFQVQWREPAGQADAGCPFLLLLWARKEEENNVLFHVDLESA